MNSSISHSLNEFESFWKPFVRVFQMFSVSHFQIFRPHIRNRFWSYISFLSYFLLISLIHISIVAWTLIRGLQREEKLIGDRSPKHRENNLMYYVNSMGVLVYFIANITNHLEPFFNGKREAEIFHRLKMIDVIFSTKLHFTQEFRPLRATYLKQIASAFILSAILATGSAFSSLPESHHYKYFMHPFLIVAVIINRARWCYIAILLKCLGNILNDLENLLKQQQLHSYRTSSGQSENRFTRENIRYFREIYSHISYITMVLSDCFGWTFMTFLVKFTFESINTSYWLYINWTVYMSTELNIRKTLLIPFDFLKC